MNEWYNREMFRDIPKNELLRLVAKTSSSTDHRNDKSIPVEDRKLRIYLPEELRLAARSLIQRPVLVNHGKKDIKGIVLDAEYIEPNQTVECIIRVPEYIVEAWKAGKFKAPSVGVNGRIAEEEGDTLTYRGLWFDEVSLVPEGYVAGDPNAEIHAFESFICVVESAPEPEKKPEDFVDEQSCKDAGFYWYDGVCHLEPKPETTEVKGKEIVDQNEQGEWCVYHCENGVKGAVIKCFSGPDAHEKALAMHRAIMANKGETVVEDERPPQDWWDSCTSAVSGIADDPEALCAYIWYYVKESKLKESKPESEGECIDCKIKAKEIIEKLNKAEEDKKRVKELQESLDLSAKTSRELREKYDKDIEKAKTKGKEEILKEVQSTIPHPYVERWFSPASKRFAEDVKRVLWKHKKEDEK